MREVLDVLRGVGARPTRDSRSGHRGAFGAENGVWGGQVHRKSDIQAPATVRPALVVYGGRDGSK